MYRHFFKRFFDFSISLIALLCLSPFLLIVIVWLYFANQGGGIFFMQERPGKDSRIFKVIKFKTMTDARDANGTLLPDAQRLTKVGRFVRSTSIDELPQLFNVLKGDMALIGPRPLLIKYLPCIVGSRRDVTRYVPASRDGRSVTDGTLSVGAKNSSWTYGMLIIVHYG